VTMRMAYGMHGIDVRRKIRVQIIPEVKHFMDHELGNSIQFEAKKETVDHVLLLSYANSLRSAHVQW
jgi:hypothetical protein